MSHSTAVAPARAASPARSGLIFGWPFALALLAFLALWLEVIHQLSSEWSLNPQYGYGWTVPFLAAWLFYQRWQERPAPLPVAGLVRGLTIILAILAALLFFPARLVAVANPDWRMISWTMALLAVVLSLAALFLAGGWPWLRYLAFPVLFFLVAVPWPVQFEQMVVQSLMRADTAITLQILNLIGTVAVRHGNVIELSTGQVGIDDACTGVRSLQATFMVALSLGEFYRMRIGRRVLLVVAAAVLAFVCNIARTLILCEVAATSGIPAIHRWHDPAGFTILFICLFGLWLLSLWLKPSLGPATRTHRVERSSFAGIGWSSGLLVWLLLAEVATATWYAPARSEAITQKTWNVTWPSSELDYRREPIPDAVETLLRYSDGGAATWRSADERRWMMYSFHWLPGRTAALFVKNHRPDICLPASGLTMEQESGVRLLSVNGVNLPISSYRFDDNGRPLHVFYCYWDGRSSYREEAAAAAEDWTARGRLRAAWQGKRERGARMLELAVWGYDDDPTALAALNQELRKIVHPE